jgi:hypothetical protein
MTYFGQPAQPLDPSSLIVTKDAAASHSDDNKIYKKVGKVGHGTLLTIDAINRTVLALPEKSYFVRAIEEATGRCIFDDEWSVPALLQPNRADFLRALNANGAHIYFRPTMRRHVLLDDINTATLDLLAKDGLMPALAVQTSDANLQVWITVSKQDLTPGDEGLVARALVRRYGGDFGAAHSSQFGRMPGFRNRKSKHRSPEGGYPLVKIVRPIRSFIAPGVDQLIRSMAKKRAERPTLTPSPSPLGGQCSSSPTMSPEEAKGVYNYTASEIARRFGSDAFNTDRSRTDHAVARNLFLNGFDKDEIYSVLSAGSEKALERNDGYITATVEAATRVR